MPRKRPRPQARIRRQRLLQRMADQSQHERVYSIAHPPSSSVSMSAFAGLLGRSLGLAAGRAAGKSVASKMSARRLRYK